MIRKLPSEIWRIRSLYQQEVRRFFLDRGYFEAETPLLNPTAATEPFLTPMELCEGRGYLITSPEYNLKSILGLAENSLFQIAHTFRGEESGPLHSGEFLLLEWYQLGGTLETLLNESEALLRHLARLPFSHFRDLPLLLDRLRCDELFERYCHCSLDRNSLAAAVSRERLLGHGEHPDQLRYDELFFTLFLNRIEPHLGLDGPVAVSHYPAELSALSRLDPTNPHFALRAELYWQGLELGNGYEELTDYNEQMGRFEADNRLRRSLGRKQMPLDEQLLATLRGGGLPDCSGMALGFDRLLMLLLDERSLAQVAPFY